MKKILFSLAILCSVYFVRSQPCTSSYLASGPNAFGTGGGITTYKQSCLTYNSDLNAVLWVNRASPLWGFSGYTSGAVQATWMNVASSTRDSMILYRDPANLHAARYPGGVFYNVPGNTNMANAYVVATGPTLAANIWDGTFYTSRQITGNYHLVDTSLDDHNVCLNGTAPFGTQSSQASNNAGYAFLSTDMQQAGNTVFVGGGLGDLTYTLGTGNNQYGGTIGKASNLSWSSDTIVPGFYYSPSAGYATDNEGVRLAFSPDGQTGYAVFIGKLATTFNNSSDSTLSPIVYRSTDGGITWASVLQGFDWSAEHPELKKNIGLIYAPGGMRHFKVNPRHGYDLTVDSMGVLHLVTSLTSVYEDGAQIDSLTYSYTYDFDHINHHPVIWDLMTDGTTWNTLLVDSIISSYVASDPASDTTASFNAWANSATFMAYGARIQVSRSVTGGKVFYSWADSDPAVTGTPFNSQPDLHMKSYDISKQKVTSTFNITNGIGTCFFHFMSDVSYYDSGSGKWISPMVYTVGNTSISPGVYDGTGSVGYYYVGCGLAGSSYVYPANVNSSAGSPCTPSVTFVMHQDSANPQPGIWEASAYYSPQVTSAVWYWGDGTSTAGMTPSHTYSSAGQYNICVTVFSACGDSASACQNDSLYKSSQGMISVSVVNENQVGIKDNVSSVAQFSIYPNPSQGEIRLLMNSIADAQAQVYITNVLGEVIYSGKEAVINNSLNKEIDLRNVANGTYFVRMVTGSKIYNSKFTISR